MIYIQKSKSIPNKTQEKRKGNIWQMQYRESKTKQNPKYKTKTSSKFVAFSLFIENKKFNLICGVLYVIKLNCDVLWLVALSQQKTKPKKTRQKPKIQRANRKTFVFMKVNHQF